MNNIHYYACDFETTVYTKEMIDVYGAQESTEVWAAAICELFDDTETVTILHSIRDFLEHISRLPNKSIFYFHNLAFDGSFIVDFLLKNNYEFTTKKKSNMLSKEFNASISYMGQWYKIIIKVGKKVIEIRDSYKLMPSSIADIGKSFETKHRKLEMVYEGERYAYCEITDEERKYIENDVLVLKEALEKMFNQNHKKLTIGSCCMAEFKQFFSRKEYNSLFPDLKLEYLDERYSNAWNQWDYVHKSYHGGWVYVNPRYAHRIIKMGLVFDVNSLYPSVMHSVSDNYYPVGYGTYKRGKPGEEIINKKDVYYFIRVRCRFKLKENALPWLHIRHNAWYKSNENLYTSDVKYNGKYYRYVNVDGEIFDTVQELTFTCKDWELFKETYYIYDLEYLDYIYYHAVKGLFDEYIDTYKEIKENNTGFLRTLSKLFLNNLYGKFSTSDDSSYKEPFLNDDGVVSFKFNEEHKKQVGYIPIGSAVTSYAMNFTIRHAMANIDRFCYADTDSVHIQGYQKPKMIFEHPTNFLCWKCEGKFDFAYYERQKMYAEHFIEVNRKPCEPFLDIKAAGMSKNAKDMFINGKYKISDLKAGLELKACNLKAVRIKGGILLTNKDFCIRESKDKKINVVKSVDKKDKK